MQEACGRVSLDECCLRAWGIQRMTPGGVRGMRHAVECVGDVKVPGGVRGGLQSLSMQGTVAGCRRHVGGSH